MDCTAHYKDYRLNPQIAQVRSRFSTNGIPEFEDPGPWWDPGPGTLVGPGTRKWDPEVGPGSIVFGNFRPGKAKFLDTPNFGDFGLEKATFW